MSDIYLNGITYPASRKVAFPGKDGKEVVFDLPDAVEAAGFSKATKARLDGTKLRALGWRPQFDMKTGLGHTIEIMRSLEV